MSGIRLREPRGNVKFAKGILCSDVPVKVRNTRTFTQRRRFHSHFGRFEPFHEVIERGAYRFSDGPVSRLKMKYTFELDRFSTTTHRRIRMYDLISYQPSPKSTRTCHLNKLECGFFFSTTPCR